MQTVPTSVESDLVALSLDEVLHSGKREAESVHRSGEYHLSTTARPKLQATPQQI